jgi:hypothetical protein
MRNFSILGACLALCTLSAQAQPVAQGSNSSVKESHWQDRCSDRYAASVGRLAFVETRLTLSGAQKPLFDRWKNARLNQAMERQAQCVARTERNRAERATPVDRMTRQEDRLKTRLAQLQAERPVFTALYASLNPEQQQVLSHIRGNRMERGGFRRGEMTGHRNFGRRHGSRNRDANPDAAPAPR